jgi:peptidyl-prolyl cis-trans isomerase SurA
MANRFTIEDLHIMPAPNPSAALHLRAAAARTVLAAALLAAGCRPAPAPAPAAAKVSDNVWATVDGRELTRDEVERAFRRINDAAQPMSDEEALTAKLSLLNDLILQDILMAKARELKVELPESELETAFADARKNIADDAFQQELAKRSLTAADMRDGLRRELLTQKVIDREVGSKVTVSAQEVSDFFIANQAQFNLPEEAYHIAQIAITPAREPQVTNRTGDDATTPQAASAKAAMLMERLKAGAAFTDLAMDYSEDPETAPRGGDLGLVPISRLKQAPPQLRDAVINKKPGTVSVAQSNGAYTLVLVAAHEPAGQRDLSTPGVRDRITEGLRARREQLLRTAYLTSIRNDAQVVNYLARRLVESQGKLPGAAPAPAQPAAPAPPAPPAPTGK